VGQSAFTLNSTTAATGNRTTIDLSNTRLKNIGTSVFSGNSALTSVTFPASLESISSSAFYSCPKLNVIDFSACTKLESIGYNAFYNDGMFGNKNQANTALVLPASLKILGGQAFRNFHMLKSVTLPGSMIYIAGSNIFPFWGSVELEKFVVDGEGLLETDDTGTLLIFKKTLIAAAPKPTGAITVPEGITEIAGGAFAHSNYTSITLPSTLKVIASDAFNPTNNSAGQITTATNFDVTVLAATPPSLGSATAAFNSTKLTAIYVPTESVETYKAAWINYAAKIQAIP
jgi:hypothetical protein